MNPDSIFYALSELYNSGNGLDAASFALVPTLPRQLDADHGGAVDQRETAGIVYVRRISC